MSRRKPARPTLLDRAIAWVDPAAGARRLAARTTYNALSGGYQGARRDRRQTGRWTPGGGSADADILPDLPELRERTRDAVRNTPIATAALGRATTLTVGQGLTVLPQIDRLVLGIEDDAAEAWEDRAQREFRLWADNLRCDASRVQDFAGLQDLMFFSALESGDVFAVFRRLDQPGWPFRLALQIYEGDQISQPGSLRDGARHAESGNRVAGGIETDDRGAPLAVHVQAVHPGNVAGEAGRQWVRLPVYGSESGRRQVLHVFHRRRPGQTRGVPFLAPVIEQLKQLADYTEAELFAAVISAMITVVHKGGSEDLANIDPANEISSSVPDREYKMQAGTIYEIEGDDEIEVPQLGRPNPAFDPFFVSIVRQIGAAIEVPFEVLIMHFTASYSASRAALEMAAQFVRVRRSWLVRQFCQPVYEALITEAVAQGRLDAPGFFNDPLVRKAWLGAEWIGPARISLDPLKENKADEIAEDRGWKTASEITAERTGGDWERKARQRGREQTTRDQAGVGSPNRSPAEPEENQDGSDKEEADDARA